MADERFAVESSEDAQAATLMRVTLPTHYPLLDRGFTMVKRVGAGAVWFVIAE